MDRRQSPIWTAPLLAFALLLPSARAAASDSRLTTREGDAIAILIKDGSRLTQERARELQSALAFDLALEDLGRERRTDRTLRVQATIELTAEAITASLSFTRAQEGRTVLRRQYAGSAEQPRKTAHELARAIARELTGSKSIAMTRIAAVREVRGHSELWIMDAGGGDARRLADRVVTTRPSWSRDGRSILYTSNLRRAPELYAIDAAARAGSAVPRLISAEPGLNTDARMSPDGARISLTLTRDGNSEIYVLEPDRSLARLTREWGVDASATWSPSGDRLAFISSRSGHDELYVMGAHGEAPIALTALGLRCLTPDWSPRGDRIVFAAAPYAPGAKAASVIYTVDPATRALARITSGSAPSFSPDGRHIVFASITAGQSELWIMELDGSHPTQITHGGGFSSPAWSPYLDEALSVHDGGPYLTSLTSLSPR